MKEEYLVSELANMFNISKRTLQYYDKIGLLSPAYIEDNGYRIYTNEEVIKLMEIIIWKNAGFESDDIKEIFSDKTKENINVKIEEVEQKLEEEIKRLMFLKRNVKQIKSDFKEIDVVEKQSKNEIKDFFIKEIEHRDIIKDTGVGGSLFEVNDMMTKGTEVLRDAIANRTPFVEFGFIINFDKNKSDDFRHYDNFYYAVYEKDDRCKESFSLGEYACIRFRGQLNELPDVIEQLVKSLKVDNYKPKGDIIYLESFTSLCYNKPEYTDGEIQIRVEKV